MGIFSKGALGLGASAILLTSAAPAFAALPRSNHDGIYASHNDYARGYRHRHRDRIDGGDVLLGIGILAGIAIIAGAASDSDRRDRAPEPYPASYPENDQDDRPSNSGSNDVGSAVQSCSAAAERNAGNASVTEIRSVTRDGSGWRVQGDLSDRSSFTCGAIDGQVDFVQIEGDS